MPVIGTAGHVDHGKSSLLEKLTGRNPMHLPEEFDRGLTIELGFGYWRSPSGRECGIVDVPGHGHFIRNMAGGAFALDGVIFVVAADDGWKPQSEEHLFICNNARIKSGLIVINKCDLAGKDRLADLRDELEIRFAETFLDGAPIVEVSALTGQGMSDLERELDNILANLPPSKETGKIRYWVDRSFKIGGAGIVVTGTLRGGSLRVDDHLGLYPAGEKVRARKIEMYGNSVASARPGNRVAINLAGSFKSVPERGSLLAMGGEPRSVGDFWAVAHVAPTWDAGVRAGGGYIAHVGTRSIDARIHPLGQHAVESRKTSICRIVLAEPAPVEAGERFTLFSSARYGVVAGCQAIYAGQLPKESRAREIFEQVRPTELFDAETFALLKILAEPTPVEDVHAGSLFSQGEMATAVESLAAKGIIELVKSANTQYAFGTAFLQKKSAEALESLKKVRAENPSLTSFSASTLQLARGISKGAQNAILEHIASVNAELVFRNAVLSIAEAPVSETLSSPSATRVLARFRGEIADYPTLKQLYQMFPQDKRVIAALLQQGQLVRLPQDILLPPKVLSRVKSQLESLLRQNDTITVADAKDVWGVTRKHVIPLLEYFDSLGITARAGDVRRRGPNFGK